MTTRALPVRFWEKVQKTETCWVWTGTMETGGYGRINVGGKWQRAHRVAWELSIGPIQAGLCVCHRCDNPPCVNPAHLFLGTQRDNLRDMVAKGRQGCVTRPDRVARGERHGSCKLTESEVLDIRANCHPARRGGAGSNAKSPVSLSAFARKYGVRLYAVQRIVAGDTWAHLLPRTGTAS
jgi:HNH endonuclease